MGQYGNQPDFGTRAKNIVPVGDGTNPDTGENLKSAALYIGTGGTLVCNVVGGNDPNTGSTYTVFNNIPDGTFFPVIVNNVWVAYDVDSYITTCSDIVALY
jgi:hypothetical protein